MLRAVALLCLVIFANGRVVWAAEKDPLARARTLYNQGQYEAALVAADDAGKVPERTHSADLIAARAYLERYRLDASSVDLVSARERLRRIDPARFTPNERLEFLVGLGETLYFDESSGASAVVFASVLERPLDANMGAADDVTPKASTDLSSLARERVLDWWASALDREARPRPDIERQGIYQRVRDRMAVELAVSPGNVAALYWSASAARAQGDLQAAWNAAQAAWVRAPLAGAVRANTLRQDLEELVAVAIVPERARILATPPETLTAEWEAFKKKWTNN